MQLQSLPRDVLRVVANKLKIRDAQALGRTFSTARAAARESLARRRPLNLKMARASRSLAQRNRAIMAVVTRLLHLVGGGARSGSAHVGQVRGALSASDRLPASVMIHLSLRVKTAAAATRGSLMELTFEIQPATRYVQSRTASLPPAGLTQRERDLATQPVRRAALKAFEANGYTVVPLVVQSVLPSNWWRSAVR